MEIRKADRIIHMIGNSHIDAAWFWRWPEGMREALSTFRSALERMDEYPDFTFTASSVAYYRWVEEHDPGLFERIRARVAEGRWRIVGGWIVEPDCDLPSGESYVRQALYGQRYLVEKFGKPAAIAYCIDSFGHNASLPSILAKSGFEYYVFMRPDPSETPLPSPLFRWTGPDGNSVTACRIPCEYTAWFRESLEKNIDLSISRMGDRDDLLCFYGVGNHGGGPTKANIDHVHEAALARDGFRLELSTLERFFETVDPSGLPSYAGELQKHSSGCMSSDSRLKQLNRACEAALSRAEILDAFGALSRGWEPRPVPGNPAETALAPVSGSRQRDKENGCKEFSTLRLASLWEKLLFCQFHDILAGTCIEEARDDAVRSFDAVLDGCEEIAQSSLQKILPSIDTRGPGFPLVIFNTRAIAAEEWVDTEVPWDCKHPLRLADDAGNEVPYQRVMTSCMMINRNFGGRRRLLFRASVPAFGYAVYRLLDDGELVPLPGTMSEKPVLDNGTLSMGFDAGGRIASIRDVKRGIELLSGPIVPIAISDPYDSWGHGVHSFDEKIGEFEAVRSETIENGPHRFCVHIEYAWRTSRFDQFFYLYRGDDRLVVRNFLDFREHHAMVKLAVPVGAARPVIRCGMPYGSILRKDSDGGETFAHGWILAYDGEAGTGLAVAGDSKYAYDLRDNVLSLTLARSAVYAHHVPTEAGLGGFYRFMDQGEQRFSFVFRAASGTSDAEALDLLDTLERPLEAVMDTNHAGPRAPRSNFIECDDPDVRIAVVKGAEDGNALVLRLYETGGRAANARIRVVPWNFDFPVDVGARELVTIRIVKTGTGPAAVPVNVLEYGER